MKIRQISIKNLTIVDYYKFLYRFFLLDFIKVNLPATENEIYLFSFCFFFHRLIFKILK